MDVVKLEGIISAIEEESKLPHPSHANLARLVAMFFRELILQGKQIATVEYQEPTDSTLDPDTEPEVVPTSKQTKKSLKNSRRIQ